MKVAGINTVGAIMDNIKGDMSKLTNVVVPTMAEIYENLEILDDEKEGVFIPITKAAYEALSTNDRESNNYIITDMESGTTDGNIEFVTADDVENWFN